MQIPGETASGVQEKGVATLFTASDSAGTLIVLAYIEWHNGEIDIRAQGVETPCKALRGLERGRLRLSVFSHSLQQSWIELRQARIKRGSPEQWSNLFQATKAELDQGAGVDLFALLQHAGAQCSGYRATILKDTSRRKNYICTLFPKHNCLVPVVAFVATRVLPLYNGVITNRSVFA